jgi:hypothetical protein
MKDENENSELNDTNALVVAVRGAENELQNCKHFFLK